MSKMKCTNGLDSPMDCDANDITDIHWENLYDFERWRPRNGTVSISLFDNNIYLRCLIFYLLLNLWHTLNRRFKCHRNSCRTPRITVIYFIRSFSRLYHQDLFLKNMWTSQVNEKSSFAHPCFKKSNFYASKVVSYILNLTWISITGFKIRE